MAKPSKKVVIGILDKLGIEHTTRINLERAKKKLERAIEENGVSDDIELNDEELDALRVMGFEIEGEEPEEAVEETTAETATEPEKEPEPKKEPKKATKKLDRIGAACVVVQKKKNHQMGEFVADSDAVYVENGGKPNTKEATTVCRWVLRVLESVGKVEIDGDKFSLVD